MEATAEHGAGGAGGAERVVGRAAPGKHRLTDQELDAFGHVPDVDLPDHDADYALLNVGRRDCEPGGLRPLLPGARLAGATSDVSVLITDQPLHPGDTVAFAIDYDALVRAMTSPFVAKEFITRTKSEISKGDS